MFRFVLLAALGLSTPAYGQSAQLDGARNALDACLYSTGLDALGSNMSVDRVKRLVTSTCAKQLAAFSSANSPLSGVARLYRSDPEPPGLTRPRLDEFLDRYRSALFAK
jgi:hypothetical protein